MKNSKEENNSPVSTRGIIKKIDGIIAQIHQPPFNSPLSKGVKGETGGLLTEYQQIQIETALNLKNSLSVYEIRIAFDAICKERAVGAFMINNRLSALGDVIRYLPDIEDEGIEKADEIIENLDTIAISVIEKDTEADEQFSIIEKFLAKNLGGRSEPIGKDLIGANFTIVEK